MWVSLSDDYNNTIKPQLDALMDQVSAMSSSLSSSASTLGSVGDHFQNGADSLAGRIATSKQKLLDTASDLDDSAQKLTSLSAAMREALASGNLEQLRTVLYSDPDALASALAAPVQLERNAVFPAITSALRWRRCIPHWLCGLVHCCWRLLSRWRCRARRRLSWGIQNCISCSWDVLAYLLSFPCVKPRFLLLVTYCSYRCR